MANQHLIEVENLKMYFKKVRGVIRQKVSYVKAVDNVSFFIDRGETFGLVGESGCGKTTTGRAISRLYEPTDGTVRYDGADITHLSAREFMAYRKKIQMIFQDPYASLNPVSYTHLCQYSADRSGSLRQRQSGRTDCKGAYGE